MGYAFKPATSSFQTLRWE